MEGSINPEWSESSKTIVSLDEVLEDTTFSFEFGIPNSVKAIEFEEYRDIFRQDLLDTQEGITAARIYYISDGEDPLIEPSEIYEQKGEFEPMIDTVITGKPDSEADINVSRRWRQNRSVAMKVVFKNQDTEPYTSYAHLLKDKYGKDAFPSVVFVSPRGVTFVFRSPKTYDLKDIEVGHMIKGIDDHLEDKKKELAGRKDLSDLERYVELQRETNQFARALTASNGLRVFRAGWGEYVASEVPASSP